MRVRMIDGAVVMVSCSYPVNKQGELVMGEPFASYCPIPRMSDEDFNSPSDTLFSALLKFRRNEPS